ncbi:iron ABC transporter permease [Shimia sp. MMG029]|nr:iron ABC transporter permease [Shimia sp. MMG029]MDA5558704.1 iron ABC transporter permease [Shimia sp. MMG029]
MLLGLLGLGAALSLAWGAHDTSMSQALRFLWQDDGSNPAFAVRALRLPRVLCAMGVGAALALSGAIIQVVTRNPLGDPGLTGVSAGAAFGVALALTWLATTAEAIMLSGIAGGLLAATLTLLISGKPGQADGPGRLILAGVAVSVFFIAATGVVMVLARASMQTLYFWMIGGFINRGWAEFVMFWPWALAAGLCAFISAPVLRLLLFEDDMAAAMGLKAARWRVITGLISVILAASAVAVAGPIGFVGFVAPHLARICLTDRSRTLMWLGLTLLIGATLVVWADTIARLLFDGRAPAGVVVSVVGGGVFLLLLPRLQRNAL